MSIVSFTSSKQGVQDLLASLPSPKSSAADRARSDEAGKDAKPGFNDLLRDSSQSKSQRSVQRGESTNAVEAQPKSKPAQDEKQASTDQAEAPESKSKTNESTEDKTQQTSEGSESKQSAEQETAQEQNAGVQADENSQAAQAKAQAAAAAAELAAAQGETKSQEQSVKVNASVTQQVDTEQAKEASSSAKQSAEAQLAATKLAGNSAGPANQAQGTAGPSAQTGVSATAVQAALPTGGQAQADSGDTRGDSKAATPNATANSTTSTNTANAAATTAFTVPDQAGSEARLPINPAGATQSADAARQVQAQPAVGASDSDSLNTARLTRGLANAVQQRGGAVTLRLTPPEMGTVRIQMQITGTSVTASFHAESASAQTLLTNQLAQLRSALESKGMSVERLHVQPMATTASHNANQSQNQSDTQQQNQSQQQSAGDGRSRGQYSGDSSRQQPQDQQQNGSAQQTRRGFFDRLHDAAQDQAA